AREIKESTIDCQSPSIRAGQRSDERTTVTRSNAFEKTTLATEIARHLRQAIIKGDLTPGQRINEFKLTKELALSRSPVREAIRILAAEGLLAIEPHRGARVRPVSEHDLEEIFDVRLMIESHGLRRAHRPLPDAVAPLRAAVDEARGALRAQVFDRWHRASLAFHDGLVALAANSHLTRLHEELKVSLHRYQISVIRLPGQPERSQVEHEAILDALERGDIDRAAALVTAHITNL